MSSTSSASWLSPSTRAQEWAQLFEDHSMPMEQLPEFKLTDGKVHTSYVAPFRYYDFFLWPGYMSHPVMRLVDTTGQKGIVFHLQGRNIEPVKPDLLPPIEIHRLDTVCAIFTRSVSDANGGDQLGYAWLYRIETNKMDYLVRGARGMMLYDSPLNEGQFLSFVREILSGQNRFFQLAPEQKV